MSEKLIKLATRVCVPLRKGAEQKEHERGKKMRKENGSRFALRFTLAIFGHHLRSVRLFCSGASNGARTVVLTSLQLPSGMSDQ